MPPSVTQCDSLMSDRPGSWHGQTMQSPAAPPAGEDMRLGGGKKLSPHLTLNAPQSGVRYLIYGVLDALLLELSMPSIYHTVVLMYTLMNWMLLE